MANLATITTNILADSGIDDINVIVSTGSYADPAWITSLAWTKITGAPSNIVTGTGTTNFLPKFTGTSTIGNSVIQEASSNIGIGVSPSRKLHVLGGAGTAQIQSTGSSSIMYFGDASSSVIDNQGFGSLGNTLYLLAGGAERLYITSAGNVGIGTASPNYLLHIAAGAANPQLQFTSTGTGSTTSDGFHIGVNNSTLNAFLLQKENAALQFLTNDTERMRLNASGNLSLGNTNDTYKLDVSGTGRYAASYTASGSVAIETWQRVGGAVSADMTYNDANTSMNFGTSTSHTLNIKTNNTTALSIASGGAATFSSSVTATSLILGNGNNLTWGGAYGANIPTIIGVSGASGYLTFYPSGSTNGEAARFTNNGNFGIGTTSPGVTLDVNGSGIRITNATPNVYFNNTVVQWKAYMPTSTNNFAFNDAVRDVLTLGYNGAASYFQGCNVGIGTTSPNNLLQVGGTTNGIIRIDGAGDNTDFGIKWASSNASIYSNTGNAYLTFATNGSERMRIASNGNIGIGTSSPSEKLHIKNGNLLLDSDAGFSPGIWMPDLNGNPSLRIVTDQIDASYTSIINAWGAPNSGVTVGTTRGDGTAFQVRSEVSLSSGFATDSGSTRFIVNGNGNVGIGTTSPSYKLDITALGYGIQHYGNSTNSLRTYAGSGYQVIEATTSTGVSQFGYVSGNFFIEAGGSERMRITSGGNVGIGTASPSAMLTLLGLTPFIRIERSGVNTWQIQNNNNVGTITGFSINNVTAGTTPFFINQDTGNLLLGATADNGFRLDVNGTGRFTGQVDSLTRFYVVATPPATNGGLINVRDTVTATNVTSFGGVFFNSSPGSDYSIGKLTENGTGFLQIRNANSGAELLRINASGAATFSSSVTANARSFIQGAAGYLFDVQTTDANQPRFQVYVDDTNGVDLISGYNSTAKSLRFVTGNTPRMTITSGGNVLIGTQTTPTPVSGVAFPLTVSSSAATRIRIDSTNASPNSGVGLYANGVQKFSFAMYGATSDFTIYNDALLAPSLTVKGNNSNVLIGTTTDTSDKLRVDGNTFTNTITTYRPGVNTTKSDAWKLGRASIGTQPTETHQITVEIGGVSYVIGAAQL
jgi:hypothetical protein